MNLVTTTLLQFVAVNASQQPPHIAVQEPHDGSRGQGVQLAEKDKALAHRVAATSLWSVSQSIVLQNQPCLRPQDGVRSLDLQDFASIMADDAGLMLTLSELSGLQSSLLLLYGRRLSFSMFFLQVLQESPAAATMRRYFGGLRPGVRSHCCDLTAPKLCL